MSLQIIGEFIRFAKKIVKRMMYNISLIVDMTYPTSCIIISVTVPFSPPLYIVAMENTI